MTKRSKCNLWSLIRNAKNRGAEVGTEALEIELQKLLEQDSYCRTDKGKAVVVRNAYPPERGWQTGIGPVTVKIPKVRSRTDEPVTFRSALLPPM